MKLSAETRLWLGPRSIVQGFLYYAEKGKKGHLFSSIITKKKLPILFVNLVAMSLYAVLSLVAIFSFVLTKRMCTPDNTIDPL